MGIWIRNQDGNLGKYFKFLPPVNTRAIHGCDMGGNVDVLGVYNSEAEALLVLDEIQNKITNIAYVQFYRQDSDFVNPVFRMPPAGFSKEG